MGPERGVGMHSRFARLLWLSIIYVIASPANAESLAQQLPSACYKDVRRTAEWLVIQRINEGRFSKTSPSAAEKICLKWVMSRLNTDGAWIVVKNGVGDPNVNRFVLAPLLDYFFMLREAGHMAPSEYLSDLKRAALLQYRAYHAQVMWDGAALSAGNYVNQDAYYALIMALAGKLFSSQLYLDEGHDAIAGIERNLLSNGAFHYIGRENESPLYHALIQIILARYYQVSADATAISLLRRSTQYWFMAMTQDGLAEAWSDVWWKQSWMPMPLSALRVSASATNDGGLVALYKAVEKHYSPSLDSFDYWDAYASLWPLSKAAPNILPEKFFLQDSDIRGVRARDGNWNFGMTQGRGLRSTFVGGLMSDGSGRIDSVLRGVQVEAFDRQDKKRHGFWLSEPEDKTALAYSKEFSALGVSYALQPSRINGFPPPEKAESPWRVTQLWGMTQNSLIGAVTIAATGPNSDVAIEGRLLLGPCMPMKLNSHEWLCGGVRLRFYSLFASEIKVSVMPAENFSFANEWMGVSFRRNLAQVDSGEFYSYIVWIGPASASAPEKVFLSEEGKEMRIFWFGCKAKTLYFDERMRSIEVGG